MATMDVRYINPFLTSVGLVFRTMADMSVAMGQPYVKDLTQRLQCIYTVAATIELRGATTGIVAMRFCKPVVFALVKALTGEMPTRIDSDCLDALGEITNMVVGNAKQAFPLGQTWIGTPKVFVRTDPLDAPPILVMPFDCSSGRFLIEARLSAGVQNTVATQTPPTSPAELVNMVGL